MQHLDWSRNANIYEVNIRQYTEDGTIDAFRKHLPRLKKMAVEIIWIMPIQPIGMKNRKGILGSYYSISDYKAVNAEFGTLADFQALVKDAHDLGMKVLLDWVANHTAWDHVWTISHPDFYNKDEHGNFSIAWDWTDIITLDYNNPKMRKQMIAAMKYWILETDIDGFRCDMAGLVPVDFWNEARLELEKTKALFMLAEDEEVVALLDTAFDMNFTWEMHHLMNAIARGEKKAQDIWWLLGAHKEKYPGDAYRMYFSSNHDENSHSGTAVERMDKAAQTFAVLTYILPGMPLIYSGQETATDKRLAFFEKDCIDWSELPWLEFYKELNLLKKSKAALACGSYGGELIRIGSNDQLDIFAAYRKKDENCVIALLNLSAYNQQVEIDSDEVCGIYTDVFSGEEVVLEKGQLIDLKPWEYLVLNR